TRPIRACCPSLPHRKELAMVGAETAVGIGDVLLWGVLPYVVLAVFVGGAVWRYRYDQIGWTTRSSQLYESRLLRWASPLFHFGILAVLVGHIVGLMVPKSWTDSWGVTEQMYHVMALGI